MALTIAVVKDSLDYWGGTTVIEADLTLDASYPAGGYAITPALLGLRTISGVLVIGGVTAGAVQGYYWNSTTGKLMVLMTAVATAAFADLTATTDVHTITVRVLIIGQR